MWTPPEGQSPRIDAYLFYGTDKFPALDSVDDASIVYHEYTHGLIGRTVVDALGWGAVTRRQPMALNEALADFFSLDYLAGRGLIADTAAPGEVMIGQHLYKPGVGRNEAIDCPVVTNSDNCRFQGLIPGGLSYGDYGNVGEHGPEEHYDGEILGQTMWQLRDRPAGRARPGRGREPHPLARLHRAPAGSARAELPRLPQRAAAGRPRAPPGPGRRADLEGVRRARHGLVRVDQGLRRRRPGRRRPARPGRHHRRGHAQRHRHRPRHRRRAGRRRRCSWAATRRRTPRRPGRSRRPPTPTAATASRTCRPASTRTCSPAAPATPSRSPSTSTSTAPRAPTSASGATGRTSTPAR